MANIKFIIAAFVIIAQCLINDIDARWIPSNDKNARELPQKIIIDEMNDDMINELTKLSKVGYVLLPYSKKGVNEIKDLKSIAPIKSIKEIEDFFSGQLYVTDSDETTEKIDLSESYEESDGSDYKENAAKRLLEDLEESNLFDDEFLEQIQQYLSKKVELKDSSSNNSESSEHNNDEEKDEGKQQDEDKVSATRFSFLGNNGGIAKESSVHDSISESDEDDQVRDFEYLSKVPISERQRLVEYLLSHIDDGEKGLAVLEEDEYVVPQYKKDDHKNSRHQHRKSPYY